MVPSPRLIRDHGRIENVLRDIALRLRLVFTLDFFLRLAAVVMIVLLGGRLAQETGGVFPYLPFAYALLGLTALGYVLLDGLRQTLSGLPLPKVARGLEEKIPPLRDDVTNSLHLFAQFGKQKDPEGISNGLLEAHLKKTAAALSRIRPGRVVSYRKPLSHLKLLVPLALALGVTALLEPGFLGRSAAAVFNPLTLLPQRETLITLAKAPAAVLRGTSLTVRAGASGYVPDSLFLAFRPEAGPEIRLPMTPEGEGRFSYRLASVQSSFRYRAVSDRAASGEGRIRVVEAPEIEALELTLLPPGYTRLPPQTVSGGNVEALKGTVVNLQARASKPVREGTLTLDGRSRLPLGIDGGRLTASILVLYPGTYAISITDAFGFQNADPAAYRISLVPDRYPEVEITSPPPELQVAGLKMLPIVYSARDDFGVTGIRLHYQIGGIQRSLPLKHLKGERATGPLQFEWDLTALALTPGDRVSYRLEAWDNDSVSGPKAGYSRTNTLVVPDEKIQAAREVERAQSIWDALLDLLADHLEEKKAPGGLSDELGRIMTAVDQYLERMAGGQIEHFDLEALKRNMAGLQLRLAGLPREKITQELERLALLAEEILKKVRMGEVETLATEMKNRQTRLVDALRGRKEPLSPETLQGLLEELEKLRELTAQVMEALSKMAAQLPDEFVNSPELEGLDFQDFFKDLDDIRQKLMAGDLEGALAAAQRLLQNLSEMMAAMARAGNQSRQGGFDRLQKEMSRQTGELEKIVKEQQKILAGTEPIAGELAGLMADETERRLAETAPAVRALLDRLRSLLPNEQQDVIEQMNRRLAEKKIEGLSQLAARLAAESGDDPVARAVADELAQALNGLTPTAEETLTPALREKFPELSQRQQQLYDRTRGLGDMLDSLSQLFPGMDSEIISDLKTAADAMGRASARLHQTDAPGAVPPEEEAIRSLSRSQQGMQQMSQQMAQQMARQMQANRWGNPLAYDPRAGWYYGPWGSLPTLPQPEVKQRREQGYTGIDREEFDPPPREAYRAPRALREQVTEALRAPIPPPYRRDVEKYFKGLTE